MMPEITSKPITDKDKINFSLTFFFRFSFSFFNKKCMFPFLWFQFDAMSELDLKPLPRALFPLAFVFCITTFKHAITSKSIKTCIISYRPIYGFYIY